MFLKLQIISLLSNLRKQTIESESNNWNTRIVAYSMQYLICTKKRLFC